MMKAFSIAAVALLTVHAVAEAADDQFTYAPPGVLEAGSGKGFTSTRVFYPTMRFPLESKPAYLNSQVYRPGGGNSAVRGDQKHPMNYSYPWHDNYCETRGWTMPLCPTGHGHQGQDIRAKDATPGVHTAVAVEDGVIAHIGTYSVTLQTKQGALFRYLHLRMSTLDVHRGDKVKQGDPIGKVSNDFDGTPTTVHLHFDVKDTIRLPDGKVVTGFISPYTSLVASYQRLLGSE
jgi:murein DD-endopeptidase MepM/ murein hydrolase activator NlpD